MIPPCHDNVTHVSQYTCTLVSTRVLSSAHYSALKALYAGDDSTGVLSPAGLTAHRRRTDLVPTIVMPRAMSGAPATPGSRHRSPGMMSVSMSRLNTGDIGTKTSGVSSSKELVTCVSMREFVFYNNRFVIDATMI